MADLRAAAERLAKGARAYWGTTHDPMSDASDVAEDWLDKHPADDDEPISDEWVWISGGKNECDCIIAYFTGPNNVEVSVLFPECSVGVGIHEQGAMLDHIKTRGQFRSLCAALGIKLKEANDG